MHHKNTNGVFMKPKSYNLAAFQFALRAQPETKPGRQAVLQKAARLCHAGFIGVAQRFLGLFSRLQSI